MNNYIQVPVNSLVPGMFVAELDIPWLESPFMMQGFNVMNSDEIARVAEHCTYVFVDPERTTRPIPMELLVGDRVRYKNRVGMREEFLQAQVDYETATEAVTKTFARLAKGGIIDLAPIEDAVVPIIDSVLRNQDALAALVRLRKKDDYGYGHCIATAVWATVLGRHIGMNKKAITNLALGASLIDVGKVKVSQKILCKPGPLNARETTEVRRHVEYGIEMIGDVRDANPEIAEIVGGHHERYDGSGYPRGLSGHNIPLGARIAGIADSYDAMITNRPFVAARSSFDAMQELSDLKGVKFQEALIEQFMQAVGLFPNGSIVEINTGHVGIVIDQNPTRRLKPKLLIVLDAKKRRLRKFPTLDLMTYETDKGNSLWIAKELEAGSYGVAPEEFYI